MVHYYIFKFFSIGPVGNVCLLHETNYTHFLLLWFTLHWVKYTNLIYMYKEALMRFGCRS